MTLKFQPVHYPLAFGVDTKQNDLALEMPRLAVAQNIDFSEPGSLKKRTGHSVLGGAAGISIQGGGNLSNITGFATLDDELICFANGKTYSWSSAINKWIDRGVYEGVELTQKTVAQRPTEQTLGDRASYNGVTLYAWEDTTASGTSVYYEVYDQNTGTLVISAVPTSGRYPRCLEVNGKLHLYYTRTSDTTLRVTVIDPADYSVTASATVITQPAAHLPYDVCKVGTSAAAVTRTDTTEYTVAIINSAGTVTSSDTNARAASATRPIAIAYQATANRLAVVRHDGTDLLADIINGSSLADVATGIVVHATAGSVDQLTCGWRTVAEAGEYRCVVFWSMNVTVTSLANVIRSKYFMTNTASAGAATANAGPSGSTNWLIHATLGTKTFSRDNGYVYVGAMCGPNDNTVQRTYLMYREDGYIPAKALPWVAGGSVTAIRPLPQVQSLGSDKWAFIGIYKNRLGTRTQEIFSDRGLKDITLDFASLKPYRGVQLGKALYLPGGFLSTYDGESVVESNFHIVPCEIDVTPSNGTGSIASSHSYSYRVYWEWRNNRGEIERSSYVETNTATLGASDDTVTLSIPTLPQTAKRGFNGRYTQMTIAVYRTEADPGPGAPYYRCSSMNPADTGNNGYITNDATTDRVSFVDGMTDATLITKEPDYQNSGELDNIAPEACSVIAAGQNRLWLSGFENQDLVVFSKVWQQDDAVAFNDALRVVLPQDGGAVKAIAPLDAQSVFFKESRIYEIRGTGPDNLGAGGYSEAFVLTSSDTGCSDARTLVTTPVGWVFQSPKGLRLLTLNFQLQDIGGPVEDYKDNTYVAALLLENKNLVLFVPSSSSNPALAFDYNVGQWTTWTQPAGSAATLWGTNQYVVATSTPEIWKSDSTVYLDNTTAYTMVAETPWIKWAGLNGFGRCRDIEVLANYVAACRMRIRIAYSYNTTWVDDKDQTISDPLQFTHQPKRQKEGSMKIRIEDKAPAVGTLTNSFKLVGLSLDVGLQTGLKRQSSSRSQ